MGRAQRVAVGALACAIHAGTVVRAVVLADRVLAHFAGVAGHALAFAALVAQAVVIAVVRADGLRAVLAFEVVLTFACAVLGVALTVARAIVQAVREHARLARVRGTAAADAHGCAVAAAIAVVGAALAIASFTDPRGLASTLARDAVACAARVALIWAIAKFTAFTIETLLALASAGNADAASIAVVRAGGAHAVPAFPASNAYTLAGGRAATVATTVVRAGHFNIASAA